MQIGRSCREHSSRHPLAALASLSCCAQPTRGTSSILHVNFRGIMIQCTALTEVQAPSSAIACWRSWTLRRQVFVGDPDVVTPCGAVLFPQGPLQSFAIQNQVLTGESTPSNGGALWGPAEALLRALLLMLVHMMFGVPPIPPTRLVLISNLVIWRSIDVQTLAA